MRRSGHMNDLEQQIQALQTRLYQEKTEEDLVFLLEEIQKLCQEYPTEEKVYELLMHLFRILKDSTSDEPEQAAPLIMQYLLPWLLQTDLSEQVQFVQQMSYDILEEWINQYSDPARETLLQASLDHLISTLRRQPTQPVCWAISTLGYQR